MQAGFREKIALVFFCCLVILGFGGLIGYLALGHSWNVAASNIDDATGSMEGYTVIIYPGTIDPFLEPVPEEVAELPDKEPSDKAASDKEAPDKELLDKAASDKEAPEKEAPEKEAPDKEAPDKDGVAAKGADVQEDADEADASDPGGKGLPREGGIPGSEAEDRRRPPKAAAPVDTAEILARYREKKAMVLPLDTENLWRYHDGTIRKVGTQRFGVFAVTEDESRYQIARKVSYFKRHEVDFIVALAPDTELLRDIKGIDIVISVQEEGLFVMGETKNGTFYVSAPDIGSVGAILISPNKVVSAKVISP